MTMRGLKVLQVVGATVVLALGGVLLWRLQGDPWAEGGLLGLMCLCLLELALAALAASEAAAAPTPMVRPETTRRGLDPAYESVIDHVVHTIKKFLALHRDYQENLSGLNSGLSQLPLATRCRTSLSS